MKRDTMMTALLLIFGVILVVSTFLAGWYHISGSVGTGVSQPSSGFVPDWVFAIMGASLFLFLILMLFAFRDDYKHFFSKSF